MRSLNEVAGRQEGLISRRQLFLIGFSPENIKTLLRRGTITRFWPAVYRVGPLEGELQREVASLLSVGPGALLIGCPALVVWRAIKPRPDEPIEVSVHPLDGRHPRPRAGLITRRLELDPCEVRTYRGLRLTSVERSLFDARPFLTRAQLQDAADEAVLRRVTSRTKLADYARLHPELAEVAGLAQPTNTDNSPYQRKALELIRAAGLPNPETEVRIGDYFADFLFREAGVVLEIDGWGPHGQKRSNFLRDRRKDTAFRALGLTVIRVAASDLDDRPYAVIADLAAAIREGLMRRRNPAA